MDAFSKKVTENVPHTQANTWSIETLQGYEYFCETSCEPELSPQALKRQSCFFNVVYRKIQQNKDYFIWLSRPPTGLYGDSQGSQCISLGPEGLVGPLGHDFLATLHL